MTKLNPYLHFKDNAREAMEFYKSVFGGELTISTFKEGMGENGPEGPEGDNVMHAMLIIGPEMTIMAADTPPHMEYHPGASIEMSLSGDTSEEEKLTGYWNKLSEDGTVSVPLDKAPWGDTFGMLTDKFGIGWLVNIAGKME
jgi:PhnB protein